MVQPEYLQRHDVTVGADTALKDFGVRMISELNREFLVCVQNGPILCIKFDVGWQPPRYLRYLH